MEAIFLNPSQEYIGIFNEKQTSLFYAYGNIEEIPKHEGEGDHKFITVDLVKMQAQQIAVDNVNAIVPFTAGTTQVQSKNLMINLSPDVLTVNQVTATVNEEAYQIINEEEYQ